MSEADLFRQPLAEMIDAHHPLAVHGTPARTGRPAWLGEFFRADQEAPAAPDVDAQRAARQSWPVESP